MIHYKDFKIIPTGHGFDLLKSVQSRRIGAGTLANPKGEFYQRDVEIGYGYTFESLVKKLSHLLAVEGLPEDATLQDYVELYKASVDEIKTIIGQ